MSKKVIIIGMIWGSLLGSYLPTIFGVGMFSFLSVFTGFIGGVLGIFISFKLLN